MRPSDEIRREARETMRAGGWILRYFLASMFVSATVFCIGRLLTMWTDAVDVPTLTVFLQKKVSALMAGLDYTLPTRAAAWKMLGLAVFDTFVNCVQNGIVALGLGAVALFAARKNTRKWHGFAFMGFRQPLGVAALYFRYLVQVGLWSMLFVVPGIVAAYRYALCWSVKADHPDWSAGKCLAESCRLMRGRKMRCFALDCSYWRPITAALLMVLVLSVVIILPSSAILAVASTCALLVLAGIMLYLAPYFAIGRAIFYIEAVAEDRAATNDVTIL